MPTKFWKNGEQVGIALDEENQKITIFAGPTSFELNGKDLKIAYQGSVVELNGGDRQEDIFLQKQAGVLSFLPSTTFTPIPQALPNIPIMGITDIISDLSIMSSLLG